MSTSTTISSAGSNDLSDYREHLMKPNTNEKQKQFGMRLAQKLGFSDPNIGALIAQNIRDYQLKDLDNFDDTHRLVPLNVGKDTNFFLNEDPISTAKNNSMSLAPMPLTQGGGTGFVLDEAWDSSWLNFESDT